MTTESAAGGEEELATYSDEPFSPAEWRRFRRDQNLTRQMLTELNDERRRLKPLIETYETAGKIGKGAMRAVAWVVGAVVTVAGILVSLKTLDWWPFKGGP